MKPAGRQATGFNAVLVKDLGYDTDWSFAGPLRDQYRIEVFQSGDEVWAKVAGERNAACDGQDAKVAICRAVAKYVLGEEVEIPEALERGEG